MEDTNKVVIKINYKAGKHSPNKAGVNPREITQWNIRRVVMAVLLLAIILGGLVYLLWNNDDADYGSDRTQAMNAAGIDAKPVGKQLQAIPEPQRGPIITQQQVDVSGGQEIIGQPAKKSRQIPASSSGNADKQVQSVAAVDHGRALTNTVPAEKEQVQKPVVDKREAVVAPGKQKFAVTRGLTRVQLAKGINNKEPFGVIISPVIVDNEKATGVFYFTELRGMKGETVYHEWLLDGKAVFTKRIKILGKRWRASTSKLMNRTYTGNWSVRLKDDQGRVLNEIKFVVKRAEQD